MHSDSYIDEMIIARRKADILARKSVRIRVIDRTADYALTDYNYGYTIDLNPSPRKIGFIAKRGCPRWLEERIAGITQYVQYGSDGRVSEDNACNQGYATIAAIILLRKGFDEYIQDELPF